MEPEGRNLSLTVSTTFLVPRTSPCHMEGAQYINKGINAK